MQKLVTARPALGSLLATKLTAKMAGTTASNTMAPASPITPMVRGTDIRKAPGTSLPGTRPPRPVAPSTPAVSTAPVVPNVPTIPTAPVAPTQSGSVYEDLFADGLRVASARRQSVIDQIKAAQIDGAKFINQAYLLTLE